MATKGRSAKKKDGARSVRHGNVTYSSRPSDNTDCRIRCSPPSRQTFGDGSKQTTVRYRHRTLDIKSPPSGKKRKPGVRTGPKTVPKTATKTTPVKTVKKAPTKKTVPKTPTKTTAKKTVKAPAVKKAPAKKTVAKPTAPTVKVTPLGRYIDGIILGVPQPIPTAVRIILPTDSVFEWYVRTWPDDDLALEIDHRLKFAQVKKAMGTDKIYKVIGVGDSVVRERIETGIRELYRDGVPANLSQALMTAKKTTAKKTASKTVSCGCAVTPAKPSKPKTVTCGCAQTPAKVKEAILNKAEKEGMNRKELDKHIVVATVPRIEAKAKAEPPKRTYTVSNPLVLNINGAPYYVWEVSNGFKGSKEHPDQRIVNARAILDFNRSQGFNSIKDVVDYINKYFVKPTSTPARPEPVKAPAKKTPAKRTSVKAPAKPTAPIQPRGVAGKFDAKQMKEIAQFIDKFDDDGRIPIFRQSATFIDYGHVMMVRVSSRIPGRSLVGLPISKTKADIWVPAEKIKERLSQAKDVQAVEYTGDSFEYTGNGGKLHFLMGNIDVATQAYRDYDDIRPPRMSSELMKKDPGDIVFRTTQSRFATDMKKVMAGCEKGEDCAVQVCPEGKYSKYEDNVPIECSTYSAKYMKMIANVISKAKNSQCVVIYRPAWPIKVVCDFGMYLVEIILAPVVR